MLAQNGIVLSIAMLLMFVIIREQRVKLSSWKIEDTFLLESKYFFFFLQQRILVKNQLQDQLSDKQLLVGKIQNQTYKHILYTIS